MSQPLRLPFAARLGHWAGHCCPPLPLLLLLELLSGGGRGRREEGGGGRGRGREQLLGNESGWVGKGGREEEKEKHYN